VVADEVIDEAVVAIPAVLLIGILAVIDGMPELADHPSRKLGGEFLARIGPADGLRGGGLNAFAPRRLTRHVFPAFADVAAEVAAALVFFDLFRKALLQPAILPTDVDEGASVGLFGDAVGLEVQGHGQATR
jgi:hypothetical protein